MSLGFVSTSSERIMLSTPQIPQNEQLFDFVMDESEKKMLLKAYEAITFVEGWDFLKTYDTKSFTFELNHPEKLKQIDRKIAELYDGHSGSSYGYTMRCMETIAKDGMDELKRQYLNC